MKKAVKILSAIGLAAALALGGSTVANAASGGTPGKPVPTVTATAVPIVNYKVVAVSFVNGTGENTFVLYNWSPVTVNVTYNYAEHAGDLYLSPDAQGTLSLAPGERVWLSFPRVSLAALAVWTLDSAGNPIDKSRSVTVAP